jgi:hypothetical protein
VPWRVYDAPQRIRKLLFRSLLRQKGETKAARARWVPTAYRNLSRRCLIFLSEAFFLRKENQTVARARIWFDVLEDRYWVSFDYHSAFIEFLKASIPSRARSFDEQSRAWSFGRAYLALVTSEARRYFPDLTVEPEPPRKRERKSKPKAERIKIKSEDFLLVEFFHAVGIEGARAAYRKAATLAHPDHEGGSDESMKYLNRLMAELEAACKLD